MTDTELLTAVVSIHAPARGATTTRRGRRSRVKFQSTRPRGARPSHPRIALAKALRFNPRAREGRDLTQASISGVLTGFNPRAREGRDADAESQIQRDAVSIHAPARGAT